MMMERNFVLVGLVAAIVISAGTFFAIAVSEDLFRRGDAIEIELANSEGLAPGADVLVAGIRAGQIDAVELAGDRVVATVVVTTPIPRDSAARVVLRNMLGRKGIEILPGRDWDNLLTDEEEPRIPLERTTVLVDVPDLGDETVDLLRDSDVDALEALVRSLADVTEDQRDEFGALLDGLSGVSRVLAYNRDDLETLVVRSETLVAAAAESDEEIVAIIDAFGSTLEALSARRTELAHLLRETSAMSHLLADLVGEERVRIDRSLRELHEILEIVDRHQVDIAHAWAYGGVGFWGFSQVGRSGETDNPYWGNILTTGVGQGGIDAIAGCGGVVDTFLDQIFGEAECPEDDGQTGGHHHSASQPAASGDLARDRNGTLGSIRRLLGMELR
jgi:phospholipid/cholesterol/gamma-HCH transport system substrate-binding protein